jgi:hypothetical protein
MTKNKAGIANKKAGIANKKAGMTKKKAGMALGLQALENPDIHCATACRRQLPIVQNSLGKSPALDSQSSKVFDRCMT